MPVYVFQCGQCQATYRDTRPATHRDFLPKCQCGEIMQRLISPPASATVMELGSRYHQKSYRKGVQEALKKRSREHMMENVGELIEKHGLKAIEKTSYLKNGRKRTVFDDK